jgi:hypothetical protein
MEITAPLGSVSIVKEREYCAALELIEGRRRLASERDHRERSGVYLRAPARECRGEGDLLLLSGENRYTCLDIEAITLVMGYSKA